MWVPAFAGMNGEGVPLNISPHEHQTPTRSLRDHPPRQGVGDNVPHRLKKSYA